MYKFSLIVPCYNEGPAIAQNLQLYAATLFQRFGDNFEIVAVNDGSPDQATLDSFLQAEVKCGNLKKVFSTPNRGKGYAVRRGIEAAEGKYVGYLDADGEISCDYILPYYELAKKYDIIIGSKKHEGSKSNFSLFRRFLSFGCRVAKRILFGLKVKDTQVGIKVFSRSLALKIFPLLKTDGFLFDLEFLTLSRFFGYSIHEAPVTINHSQAQSSISAWSAIKLLWQVFKLYAHLRFRMANYGRKCYRHFKVFSVPFKLPRRPFFRVPVLSKRFTTSPLIQTT